MTLMMIMTLMMKRKHANRTINQGGIYIINKRERAVEMERGENENQENRSEERKRSLHHTITERLPYSPSTV